MEIKFQVINKSCHKKLLYYIKTLHQLIEISCWLSKLITSIYFIYILRWFYLNFNLKQENAQMANSYDQFNNTEHVLWKWPTKDDRPRLNIIRNWVLNIICFETVWKLIPNIVVSLDKSPSPFALARHLPSCASPACFTSLGLIRFYTKGKGL